MVSLSKFLCAAVLMLTMASIRPAQAQSTGTICVTVVAGQGNNATATTPSDAILDINVNLMVNSNIIIANKLTEGKDPVCFENLTPQEYTIQVDNPEYDTPPPVTVAVRAGEREVREFSVARKPPPTPVADNLIVIPLTQPVRFGMSLISALLAMLVMSGIGLVIYGLLLYRRPESVPSIPFYEPEPKDADRPGSDLKAKAKASLGAAPTRPVPKAGTATSTTAKVPETTPLSPANVDTGKSKPVIEIGEEDEFLDSLDDEFGDRRKDKG